MIHFFAQKYPDLVAARDLAGNTALEYARDFMTKAAGLGQMIVASNYAKVIEELTLHQDPANIEHAHVFGDMPHFHDLADIG